MPTRRRLKDMAFVLRSTMRKIEKVLERPAYNFIVHSAPVQEPESGPLPLASGDHPEADESGGVRVGNRILHQSDAAGGIGAFPAGGRAGLGCARHVRVWYKTLGLHNCQSQDCLHAGEEKESCCKEHRRRMSKPQGTKPVKSSEPERTVATRDAAVAVAQPLNAAKQLSSFEAAMKLFHTRKLGEARELFQIAASGPERDVAQRARLHIAMCDRRLEQATVKLGSAEDYYNYGVALINARKIGEARTHLEKALQMAPGTDHIHYALALAQALSGRRRRRAR